MQLNSQRSEAAFPRSYSTGGDESSITEKHQRPLGGPDHKSQDVRDEGTKRKLFCTPSSTFEKKMTRTTITVLK